MAAEHPIFVVFLAAVAAPLIAQTRLGSRLPVVVFEVVPGIVIGPHVLELVADHGFLAFMREVGMVAVMFMAGTEIDFARIRGRPLAQGAAGWLASLAVGAAALVALEPMLGLSLPAMLVIALVTTGLRTLLPILRDGGLLATPFGALLLAAATVGEVGPIVAASLVLSSRFSTWQEFALLDVFLGLVALAIALGAGLRPPKLLALLPRTMHTSTQLPVRLALLLLALSSSVASPGIVVVVTSVGLKSGQLDPDIAEALIGAALLSLLVYPTAARVLLARAQAVTVAAGSSSARA
jgi:Kef-type K+ transport system membrane component KefB